MKPPRTDRRSPNFQNRSIPVEFLLLHYTACDLEQALTIFENKSSGVSCHLLIAESGECFELVPCWGGVAKRAAHAGQSHYSFDGNELEGFNKFSIGVELVNKNGNLLPFTDAQYQTLSLVLQHLKATYPVLRSPHRILGHEHVAGWRGKADPGAHFSWSRFFAQSYPGEEAPVRLPVCPDSLMAALARFLPLEPRDRAEQVEFWHALSAATEAAVALQYQQRERHARGGAPAPRWWRRVAWR